MAYYQNNPFSPVKMEECSPGPGNGLIKQKKSKCRKARKNNFFNPNLTSTQPKVKKIKVKKIKKKR